MQLRTISGGSFELASYVLADCVQCWPPDSTTVIVGVILVKGPIISSIDTTKAFGTFEWQRQWTETD